MIWPTASHAGCGISRGHKLRTDERIETDELLTGSQGRFQYSCINPVASRIVNLARPFNAERFDARTESGSVHAEYSCGAVVSRDTPPCRFQRSQNILSFKFFKFLSCPNPMISLGSRRLLCLGAFG